MAAANTGYPSIGAGLSPLLGKTRLDSFPLPPYLRMKSRQRRVAPRNNEMLRNGRQQVKSRTR